MPDVHYLDRRLVAVYDSFSPPGPDTDFYARLAGRTPTSVLDIGCGTGRLALRLAADGHRVTGVDSAGPMLDVARAQDVDARVAWVEADARSLSLGEAFDLAVMTGHAFQVFLDDADVASVLERARAHLLPGGRLAFETRNPAAKEREQWTPERSRRTVTVAGLGEVTEEHRVLDVAGELVSFESSYQFATTGERLTSLSTLRFMDVPTLQTHLEGAGFAQATFHGDWDASPTSPYAPEIIVIAAFPPPSTAA